jgi:hypothetical protein
MIPGFIPRPAGVPSRSDSRDAAIPGFPTLQTDG